MRKIVDSNQLQSDDLRLYLTRSSSSFAVLTDYAAMEAYKGKTLTSIFKSMEVLSDFPDQVLVLKSTRVICGLCGRSVGLQRRLIDKRQTREFPVYIRCLRAAENGNTQYVRSILKHGEEASKHMDTLLRDAAVIADAIADIAKIHTKEERAAFRNGTAFPLGMVDNIVKHIMLIAVQIFRQHPNVNKRPCYEELFNTFVFRFSLCMYLLALDWAAKGGVQTASPDKVRNDMVDMNFAAYATYFDGLLTGDLKTARLHRLARVWLAALFDCKLPGGFAS